MKSLLLALALVSSFGAFASESPADYFRVTTATCGDIDPFIIGDACVIKVENYTQNFVIVIDSDAVFAQMGNEELVGSHLILDRAGLVETTAAQRYVLGKLVTGVKSYMVNPEFVQFNIPK